MEALFLKIRGALIAAAAVTILALAQDLGFLASNPVLIGIVVVVYAAFIGGIWDGITSALFILIYVSYLVVSGLSLDTDLIFLFVATPAVAIMVSILKYRLEVQAKKLSDLDRTKTEFMAIAAHQLRTPLSTIKWCTEILLDDGGVALTEEQKKELKSIAESNERMVWLVNVLLNVSRIEMGLLTVEQESTDLRKVAEAVFGELAADIAVKSLVIDRRYELDHEIRVDRKLLHIIFQNLISNAVKYTPARGKVTVEIARSKVNGQKSDVVIRVSDTGFGIPKQAQSKIFTKLFRADNVKTQDTSGTGLGLYIVKSILDRLGGSITFVSEEHRGTTFEVHIPIGKEAHAH